MAWQAGLWPAGHLLHTPAVNNFFDHYLLAICLQAAKVAWSFSLPHWYVLKFVFWHSGV